MIDTESTVAENLIAILSRNSEYKSVFITPQDAILMADSRSLLVIVDTNRPDQVESETLLLSCNNVAVIDHHRRAAAYIENAALNFHEPYASSASELVAEMMQYLVDQNDILKIEAEALLAGIVLDTKSFAVHTGSRTFDAAAYLRRSGADTTDVKRLLQSDFETTMEKYAIIRSAHIYKPGIAVAMSEEPQNRVIIAQAADELLNIAGSRPPSSWRRMAATRLSPPEASKCPSYMEMLGGGGNQSTAGVQISGMSRAGIMENLTNAIDKYLESLTQNTL